MGSEYKYILAYAIVGVALVFIMRFKAGYAAIYYTLILAIIMLFLVESKFIAQSLAPLTTTAQ